MSYTGTVLRVSTERDFEELMDDSDKEELRKGLIHFIPSLTTRTLNCIPTHYEKNGKIIVWKF